MDEALKKAFEKDQQAEQEKLKELAARSFCPVCNSCMAVIGALTLVVKGEDPENIGGNYCTHCYLKFIADNVPKFQEKIGYD